MHHRNRHTRHASPCLQVKRKSAGFVLVMRFNKPALNYRQQIELLVNRGLLIPDEERAHAWLQRVGYYRLSAYYLPFKVSGTDRFVRGSRFDSIVDLYKFDCALRILVLQALDRIEVAVRASITYHLAHEIGPFGYTDPANFAEGFRHAQFLENISREEGRSAETFVTHYRQKYIDEVHLPLWMATELLSFGSLSKMYESLRARLRKHIARDFGQPQRVFTSWLHSLAATRNICAHHNRLWNRELSIKPELPVQWGSSLKNERFYCSATIIRALLNQTAPGSQWADRLKAHFTSYPEVPLHMMHFPTDWQHRKEWQTEPTFLSKFPE